MMANVNLRSQIEKSRQHITRVGKTGDFLELGFWLGKIGEEDGNWGLGWGKMGEEYWDPGFWVGEMVEIVELRSINPKERTSEEPIFRFTIADVICAECSEVSKHSSREVKNID